MGRERYVVDACSRRPLRGEVAEAAGISKAWLIKLIARHRAGG